MRFDQLADLEKSFKTKNASKPSPLTYTSGAEELKVSFFESPNTFHFKETAEKKICFTVANYLIIESTTKLLPKWYARAVLTNR